MRIEWVVGVDVNGDGDVVVQSIGMGYLPAPREAATVVQSGVHVGVAVKVHDHVNAHVQVHV